MVHRIRVRSPILGVKSNRDPEVRVKQARRIRPCPNDEFISVRDFKEEKAMTIHAPTTSNDHIAGNRYELATSQNSRSSSPKSPKKVRAATSFCVCGGATV